jgi:hypothetical protein
MRRIAYIKRWWCLLCFIFINSTAYTQDSSHMRISLLTCTPGDDLYAIFGHTALRVTDSSSVTDIVFNYGTFNFAEEGFYVKFMRGKLLYYLSIEDFRDFALAYQAENRGITEQVLDLSAEEKLAFREALIENLKEEKKYYLYDFFLDNCTTRLRDMILDFKHPRPLLPAVMPVNTTFRQAIHHYLDKGNKQWSKLGIDILMGPRTDAVMTPSQQQFLPDNLMTAIDSSNVPVVKSSASLFPIAPRQKDLSFFTPINVFIALLILYFIIAIGKNKWPLFLESLDRLLFFVTGLTGIILLLMWFGTDHRMTKNNYNLLWLWPTNLFLAFIPRKKSKLVRTYLLAYTIVLALLLLCWTFLPQKLNMALIPLVMLLGYRSVSIYLTRK